MCCFSRFPFCNHQCQLFDWLISMILGIKVFLLELVDPYVADSRESFCRARLNVEPLAGYGDPCPHASVCSATIGRGGAFIVPHWVSLQRSGCCRLRGSGPDTPFECALRRPTFSSGSCFSGPRGVFDGFIWPDDAPATVIRASASAP